MRANFLSFLAPPADIIRCNSLAAILYFNYRSNNARSFTHVNNHVELFRQKIKGDATLFARRPVKPREPAEVG